MFRIFKVFIHVFVCCFSTSSVSRRNHLEPIRLKLSIIVKSFKKSLGIALVLVLTSGYLENAGLWVQAHPIPTTVIVVSLLAGTGLTVTYIF